MAYDFVEGEPTYPVYDLNPEIIESACYLWKLTGEEKYMRMVEGYWMDILKHCRTEVAFTAVEDVRTMKKRDYMATYFFAETLKYIYLTFSPPDLYNFIDYVFTTEAHPFRKDLFDRQLVPQHLGFNSKTR